MTPAGVPVVEGLLEHLSRQSAGGFERDVRCEVNWLAVGHVVEQVLQANGSNVAVTGFLSARSLKNPRLVLHIQHIEFVKV